MSSSPTNDSTRTYGGFYAVFLPTFLTLVSMGFFLRMGWILAAAGPLQTLAIILISTLLSLITALSISTTISNLKIESGSVFFLLSRSFGLEISSAISLPLFFAQALSTSFYTMGCAEIVHLMVPSIPTQETTLVLLILVTIITLLSSKIVLKTQLFVFVCVCSTLVSFYLGNQVPLATTSAIPLPHIPFWTLFALFFPIVTGIEGSLSFIQNLKNPSRSIPLGLISAILCALIIYITTAYALHIRAPKELLINPLVMKHLSSIPSIVIVGILGSTFSAALASALSAANSIKAFADNGIIPQVFSHPSITLLLSIMISFFGITFGNINNITPLLSMFFLISYGMLNAATGVEALIGNPSWRPTLNTPWLCSILGAAFCFIIMLLVDPAISLIATTFIALLYLLMKKRHLSASWEDMRYSILLFLSRYAIYSLNLLQPSPKTWRPNLLVFVGDPLLRAYLTHLTSCLTHKKGFLIISSIITPPSSQTASHEEQKLSLFLEKTHIPALIRIKEAPNLITGMKSLIGDIGIGHLYPNTIVLGASEKLEKIPLFAEVIAFAYKNKKNLLLIREKDCLRQQESIDVWWGGRSKNNSELMLVIAYMLQTSHSWKGSRVTLKTAVHLKEDVAPMQANLDAFLTTSRLHLHTEVVLHKTGDVLTTTMNSHSRLSDLVFLGMRPPEDTETIEEYSQYYAQLLQRTQNYPPIIYVLAGESIEFSKILI